MTLNKRVLWLMTLQEILPREQTRAQVPTASGARIATAELQII